MKKCCIDAYFFSITFALSIRTNSNKLLIDVRWPMDKRRLNFIILFYEQKCNS